MKILLGSHQMINCIIRVRTIKHKSGVIRRGGKGGKGGGGIDTELKKNERVFRLSKRDKVK